VIATAVHPRAENAAAAVIPTQSAVTNMLRPIAISDLTLAATSTAVNVSLLLLHRAFADWSCAGMASSGAALLSEMVGNAVELTGVPGSPTRWRDRDDLALVDVRLLLFEHSIVIEVADRHRSPPVPSDTFRSLSKRWHFYPTPVGRVVWCELELSHYDLTEHGLPKREPSPVPPPRQPPAPAPSVDQDLLQRLRKGLNAL
jgi:hypothetical protein